jgi:hypothetical protein
MNVETALGRTHVGVACQRHQIPINEYFVPHVL